MRGCLESFARRDALRRHIGNPLISRVGTWIRTLTWRYFGVLVADGKFKFVLGRVRVAIF